MSLFSDVTLPYSRLEAWAYDTFIAGAVLELVSGLGDELLREVPAGARVLDVGCGGGQALVHFLGRRPDLRGAGLDLAPGQIARATRRAARAGLSDRVELVRGSAMALPWSDASFDAVFSCASIKHWPDRSQGLAECVRVLAPGGRLLVAEVDRGARLDDARRFVDRWAVPGVTRELGHALFQRVAAMPSLDAADLEHLAAALPLEQARVVRRDGVPAVFLEGVRRAAG